MFKPFVLLLAFCFLLPAIVISQTLPGSSNSWFLGSGACEMCHGKSSFALFDNAGNDVSPVSQWRSTMLANASKDPFWLAKVKHEGIENPKHKHTLENTCTRCHAPMGMINAFLNNSEEYTLDALKTDPMGKDGISCTLCHQINNTSSPLFSGTFKINELREIYGPFQNPITQQMFMNTGFTPVFSEKINNSRLCGSCHTLLTNSVNLNGEFTGETFVEQAIYQEWENSEFGLENKSCQSCHLPRLNEGIKISSRPGFLTLRSPFGQHYFTGGNVFMLELMKNNHNLLGLNSTAELMAETISRTTTFLKKNTLELEIEQLENNSDTIFFKVEIENKAGHKFPTGYPSRRAFIEFLAVNGNDTLFHSGKFGQHALSSGHENFEPHHEKITREDQVQIYEFVMGDTENNVTTILERAFLPLKDNRIVPKGFNQFHANYDTVKVVGKAEKDADYYSSRGKETILYGIPKNRLTNNTLVKATFYYETVPQKWVKELFAHAAKDDDIKRFETMYISTQQKPVFIAGDSVLAVVSTSASFQMPQVKVFPNPSNGKIRFEGIVDETHFSVYTFQGKMVKQGVVVQPGESVKIDLPPGEYIILTNSSKNTSVNKLILN